VKVLDAFRLLKQESDRQRDLERRRREIIELRKHPLNYPLLEALVNAAAKQNPGFYSELTFSDGSKWEFGVRERHMRPAAPHDETF
jgi:hypothetical protein